MHRFLLLGIDNNVGRYVQLKSINSALCRINLFCSGYDENYPSYFVRYVNAAVVLG